MKKFVPLSKQSKAAQKEYHARKRVTWQGISPVTRVVPNGKAYNRAKVKDTNRKKEKNNV